MAGELKDIDPCELPSVTVYKYLEILYDGENSGESCTTIAKELSHYNWTNNFCHLVSQNLNDLLGKREYSIILTTECTKFYYWLHNYIFNMVKKDEAEYEKIIPHFYQIIQNKLKGGKFDTINECQHYSYDTKIADIIQKKSIYDYMNNYRSLITMNNIPNSQCKEPHLKYIAEVTSTCNKIYPTWGRNYEQCPDIYKKFMNKDPVTLIYILGWQEEPILRELIKVIKVARGDTVTLRVEGLNQSHEEDPEAGMMTTQLDHNADRDIMPEGSDNQPRREVIAAKDFQTAPVNEDMQGLTDNPGSPNITKTIIIPSLTTVFTFFTMYKFTPVGSWIGNTLFKKKRIIPKIDEAYSREILQGSHNSSNINSQGTPHNIGYHPS